MGLGINSPLNWHVLVLSQVIGNVEKDLFFYKVLWSFAGKMDGHLMNIFYRLVVG